MENISRYASSCREGGGGDATELIMERNGEVDRGIQAEDKRDRERWEKGGGGDREAVRGDGEAEREREEFDEESQKLKADNDTKDIQRQCSNQEWNCLV